MKKKSAERKSSPLWNSKRIIIDNSLKESYQKDLNSPFIERKRAQAIAFLNEHGLPEGWGEWKKQGNKNNEPISEKVIEEKK